MFTLYYFIVFYFSLVILSHSLLHYTTHYVATVYIYVKNSLISKNYIIGVSTFYISYLLIGGREVHPGLHFTPQYVGKPSLAIGPDCLLQDGTTHHLTYSPSRRAPLFWSTLCYTLM